MGGCSPISIPPWREGGAEGGKRRWARHWGQPKKKEPEETKPMEQEPKEVPSSHEAAAPDQDEPAAKTTGKRKKREREREREQLFIRVH